MMWTYGRCSPLIFSLLLLLLCLSTMSHCLQLSQPLDQRAATSSVHTYVPTPAHAYATLHAHNTGLHSQIHTLVRPVRASEGLGKTDNSTRAQRDQPRESIQEPMTQASKVVAARSSSDMARLSHNISAILENLLMNYNNQVRPGYHEGRTTVVKFSLLIRSMGPISEKDMKYSMECYLRQEWSDDRLRFNGPLQQLTLNIKMLEALWKPDTYFHNGLGSYVHMTTRPNKLIRINQSGDILYSMRLTIKAKCPMELRNFPMDKQSCPLVISSCEFFPSLSIVGYHGDGSIRHSVSMTTRDYIHSQTNQISPRHRHHDITCSAFRHHDITCPAFRHHDITCSAFRHHDITCSAFRHHDITCSAFRHHDITCSAFRHHDITCSAFRHHDITCSAFRHHDITWLAFRHHDITWLAFRHHDITWLAFRHHDITWLAFRHHDITCSAFRHHDITWLAFRHHDITCPAFRHHDITCSAFRHHDITWLAFRHHDITCPAFRHHDITCSAFRHHDITRSAFRHHDITWLAFRHHDITRSAFRHHDITCPAFRHHDITCSAFRHHDITRSAFRHHDITWLAFRHHDITCSAFRHHDITRSAFRHHDITWLAFRHHDITWLAFRNHDITCPAFRNHDITWLAFRHHDITWLAFRHHDITRSAFRHHDITWLAFRNHDITWLAFRNHDITCSAFRHHDITCPAFRNHDITWMYSALRVNFNLSRSAGYFLIQVYIPCILIVVLSWVSFWINREATSDRVGLGITTVLTLSTISLDTRTDLPKVHYATALDWFILMSFGYCIATLLQFAGVHFFTKDSGVLNHAGDSLATFRSTETQTEKKERCWTQFYHCVLGDENYRRERQRTACLQRSINSVSVIDTVSRILFPMSYGLLNLWYWYSYYDTELVFNWTDPGFDDIGIGLQSSDANTGGERRQGQ
nr:uncharacterized protein LOC128684056 [Cherax quadricarinatus]